MTWSERVTDLIARMTREEKLGQVQIVFRTRQDDAADLVRDGLGSIFWPRSAAATNALQRVAIEETRLGIPLLVGLDVVHGQFTIGPTPLATAASFDPDLVERLARLAATEARSGGVTWTFSPMIDVSRDPRWGRVVEGFGEDVMLTSVLGAAMIRGYQSHDLAAPDAIAATAKHFVAYGAAEGGRDYNTVDLSEHRLRSVYLEPFRAAVVAGAASVMASFNTVNGVPVHASRRLLTGVLKDEWGFDGVVVGDADGVRSLLPHGVAATLDDAVRMSFAAGLDVEMGGAVAEVDDRVIDDARLDDAVARVLTLKERLGLFARPYADEAAERTVPDAAGRRVVREASARSMVLLQNDGTLPLSASPGRVLLTGPYAESTDHLGAWTQAFAAPAGSVAEALRSRLADVAVASGTGFLGGTDEDLSAAAEAAQEADIVVVLVGEPSALSGEAASRSDLRLPGRQEELIRRVAASGTPFVVVLVTGRPLVVESWIDLAPTVLLAWHGGTEAAAAIADVLLGDADPAGRLPMSFPRSVGQIPLHYAHERTGRPATRGGVLGEQYEDVGLHGPANVQEKYTSKYLDLDLDPRFAFGHGGGYARFEWSAPEVSDWVDDGATLAVEVTNTAGRDGDEVALVFAEQTVASLAPPVRRLVAFGRRAIAAGTATRFEFRLTADALAWWTADGVRALEPGLVRLHVGPTLDATQSVDLVIPLPPAESAVLVAIAGS